MKLSNITLVCIDTQNHLRAIKAIMKSVEKIDFGSVIYFSDKMFYNDKFKTILIDKITSKEDYSRFIIQDLNEYIETDFVLIIQYDGYIINPNLWKKEFLDYDYIGAPWWYNDEFNVGNGGFSLRSKKLLSAISVCRFSIGSMESCNPSNLMFKNIHPEDDAICRKYRSSLELKYDIKFAPENIASKFSYEPNVKYPKFLNNTFGFHGVSQLIL